MDAPEWRRSNDGASIPLPPELIEHVAERAAELVAERQVERDGGYLDVKGAARFLSCGVHRIYALTSARRIPFEREGGRLLFDPAELDDGLGEPLDLDAELVAADGQGVGNVNPAEGRKSTPSSGRRGCGGIGSLQPETP